MVTFLVICVAILIILSGVLCGVLVAAGLLAGPLLIIADVILGTLPFILIFSLIGWLFKKRG